MWPVSQPPTARAAPSRTAEVASAAFAPPTTTLAELLSRVEAALTQSKQELAWLTAHPLWLPTPLAPLFKALRWEAVDAAYLLLAVLTATASGRFPDTMLSRLHDACL